MLIVNADDWGRNVETTDRIHQCVKCGTISSVSAMVFMDDSERGASIASNCGVEAGLHLNLTTEFTASRCSVNLLDHQHRVSRFLLSRRRWAYLVYHPGLSASFEYVVRAQYEEFTRLYGREPDRLDGHHHMHLCANVLIQGLLPRGKMVRRNFSFRPGEKPIWNRLYRSLVDSGLARRHRITDYFFSIEPLTPRKRLEEIFSLASTSIVEVETHPAISEEFMFLTSGEIFRHLGDVPIEQSPPIFRAKPPD